MTQSPITRGIDHVGITVPDVEAATAFFVEALGAVHLYDMLAPGAVPVPGEDAMDVDEEAQLGVPRGARMDAVRALRLGNGPTLELFEYSVVEQRPVARPCDLGFQHLALMVDDIDAAAARIVAAGGEALAGPTDLTYLEAGPGNKFLYMRTPWGSTIELIAAPSPMRYEDSTKLRRWRPSPDG